jgi:spermidine synthase
VLRLALHTLFFLSGAAALGYQLVWAKLLSTGLGHEMPAVLAIICAFMAGMALGAAFIDRLIPRSARSGLWLCGLELTIGAWAVLVSFLISHTNDLALRLIGLTPNAVKHWLIAFSIPAIVLLPATAAMGATFPAMEKFLSALAPKNSSIGSVYGANTFGAVAGTLLAPYALMPALGFAKSCWVFAAFNMVVSLGCLALARVPRSATERPREPEQQSGRISRRNIAVTLFLTGLLGIGYETAGVRVLSQVLENTVYTYAAVLAVFLAGNAAGAASYHRWWRHFEPTRLLSHLLNALAIAALLGVFIMAQTQEIHERARRLGDSMPAVLMAELITASAVFALPTFFMGAVFSHLVQLARAMRGRIGDVVALNTLGAAVAPALCLMLLPALRCKWTLITIGVGYACVPITFKLPRSWLPLVIVVALWLACISPLRMVEAPPGGRVADYREGIMASVAVLADADGHRTLRVDNRFQMGGTAAADAEYRQAHLPLLLHPAPKRALFLGLGTGISFGAASLYPGLKADGVELVPEVVEVMPAFQPQNFSPAEQPNLKLHVADARRFVRTTGAHYDVIIGDLFHPYRDGAGALYTREHFVAIRQRLATNGLFCQWLPLHQLDEPTLRVITRTFLDVFPNAEAWLLRFNVDVPVMALVARHGQPGYSANWIESRLNDGALANELKRLALGDSVRIFGHLLAGPAELRAFANDAPLNTDQDQRVTFMAPRLSYQKNVKPYATLLTLLAVAKPDASVVLPNDTAFAQRVSRYIAARNVYLHGLIHDAEKRSDAAVDAYIESARLSPDFTSGYAQCLSLATVISKSDPAHAKRILERLIEAQPARPVAREMLEKLFPR